MWKNKVFVGVSALVILVSLLAGLVYFNATLGRKTSNATIAVCAVRDIHSGKSIEPEDVAEKEIRVEEIPPGFVSRSEAYAAKGAPDFYATSKRDVIGRVSVGISKGQLIVHRMKAWAGFGGANTVTR